MFEPTPVDCSSLLSRKNLGAKGLDFLATPSLLVYCTDFNA